jgi:hypothetical protein
VTCAPNCEVPTDAFGLGGKLAQSYVKDAQVWADQLVNGVGNLEWDAGEPLALSGLDGDYQLSSDAPWILSGDFQIVTSGGKKADSSGNWVDASPMVAPAPESGQTESNVTPLTTLVAFEPALKEKLEALGGWNADIASPSGVSGNLLRIAKTVETLSSTLSGGSSPVVSDFGSSLKSLGKLATQLNAAADLTDESVLKASAASAISAVVSDPTLVSNPPTADQKAALANSVRVAVQGIANAIPATSDPVIESPDLLSQIEEVLDNASIGDSVAVTFNMGSGSTLSFGAVITEIEMTWTNDSLILTVVTADDDPSSLKYRWLTFSQTLKVADPTMSSAKIPGFDGTNLKVLLTVLDDTANTSDTRSCTWQGNPTVCEF